MEIRSERESDWPAIRLVNESAFGRRAEAVLVDALRMQARPLISFVAEFQNQIVGHILFSPVLLPGYSEIMGLAPMAVLPAHQHKGIGSALVRAGLDECKRRGFGAVVVLGHPEYYSRFGFTPASSFRITCKYDAPQDAFMVIELQARYLDGAAGEVQYHACFDDV